MKEEDMKEKEENFFFKKMITECQAFCLAFNLNISILTTKLQNYPNFSSKETGSERLSALFKVKLVSKWQNRDMSLPLGCPSFPTVWYILYRVHISDIVCVYLSPCAWLHCCLQLFAALTARGSESPDCGHMQCFPVGERSCPFPNRLGNMTCFGQWDRNTTLMAIFCLFLSQFPFSFYHWHVNGMLLTKAAASGWVPEWNEHDSWSSGEMSISENKSLLSHWDLGITCYKSTRYRKLTDKLLF